MRRFLSFSEAVLSEAGVTSQQYQALLVLKVAPQSRIMLRQLAEEMLIQHHGAVQLVDRLVAAGLALRIPSADDKRRVLVGLTDYGERVLNFLAKRHLGAMLDNEPLLIEFSRVSAHWLGPGNPGPVRWSRHVANCPNYPIRITDSEMNSRSDTARFSERAPLRRRPRCVVVRSVTRTTLERRTVGGAFITGRSSCPAHCWYWTLLPVLWAPCTAFGYSRSSPAA
ncbi:MarR family winged helix-turn-helix transcriptional regulator (plasmid) [Sinorhizobium sp. M103]|nr:MarR family winged helix-turn-helix transcriptional regulator [Sinorhizobium sp. M103]WEJ12349.1 MarR family winged helix-turn-helix transcriptional regulator [Sinorhizobium sp. M103]